MNETIKQLEPLFNEVAEKIGQGANLGWEIVVRQQIAYGLISLFLGVLGLAIIISAVIYVKKKNKEDFDWSHSEASFAVGSSIFVGLTIFTGGSITAILYLTNPEFYALQFFINLVK